MPSDLCTAQLLFQLLCLDSHKDNVRCTAVDEQLGQLKQRKSNLLAQLHLPTHDLFWANLRVQLQLPPLRSLDLAWNPCGVSVAPTSVIRLGYFNVPLCTKSSDRLHEISCTNHTVKIQHHFCGNSAEIQDNLRGDVHHRPVTNGRGRWKLILI